MAIVVDTVLIDQNCTTTCKQSVDLDLNAAEPWMVISHGDQEISLSVKNFNNLVSTAYRAFEVSNKQNKLVNEVRCKQTN